MSELTLLLSGGFCFGLTVLGVVLTVIEFERGSQASAARAARKAANRGRHFEREAAPAFS